MKAGSGFRPRACFLLAADLLTRIWATNVSELRNIGPVSARWLAEIGVESLEDLERVGVVEAYRRTREIRRAKASLNLLWALQGAVMDLHWTDVPGEIKQELLDELG